LEVVGIDERIILELVLEKYTGEAWIGFVWPRIGSSGGLL